LKTPHAIFICCTATEVGFFRFSAFAILRNNSMTNFNIRNVITAPFSDRASQILSAVIVVLSGVLALVTFATV
jgi:hypothetical protein